MCFEGVCICICGNACESVYLMLMANSPPSFCRTRKVPSDRDIRRDLAAERSILPAYLQHTHIHKHTHTHIHAHTHTHTHMNVSERVCQRLCFNVCIGVCVCTHHMKLVRSGVDF